MRHLILCSVAVALLVGLILALTMTGAGQTNTVQGEQKRFKVSVSVSCSDETLKAEMESYIKRELRVLGDVALHEAGEYLLTVNVLEGRYKPSGTKTGYVFFSWLGEKAFNPMSLKPHCVRAALDVTGITELIYASPYFMRLQINVPRAEVKQSCQAVES